MKLLIAGSRTITDYGILLNSIYDLHMSKTLDAESVTEVISGVAPGIDTLGEQWANEVINGPGYTKEKLPVKQFPADWEKYGPSAGPIRNKQMAEYADQALIIWDGTSKGTKNMLDHLYRKKKKVYLIKV